MALILPPKKKIEDAVPELAVRQQSDGLISVNRSNSPAPTLAVRGSRTGIDTKLDPMFRSGMSFEDMAQKGGYSTDEVRRYAQSYHPEYGDRGMAGNAINAVTNFVGDMFKAGAGIVTKPINDIRAMDPNYQAQEEANLRKINADYQSGTITRDAALERAQQMADKYTTKQVDVRDGNIALRDSNPLEFGGKIWDQGAATASLLPVGGGVAKGGSLIAKSVGLPKIASTLESSALAMTGGAATNAESRLAAAMKKVGIGNSASDLIGNAVTSNAKQSLMTGTGQTVADVMSGREVTPESIALNYGADFALGTGAEVGLGGAGLGISKVRGLPLPEVRAPEVPQFKVDEGIVISDTAKAILEKNGVTAVNRRGNPYGASYEPGTRSINVNGQEFANDGVLFHELGHDMWANRLTPEERALFDGYGGSASAQAKGRDGYTQSDVTSEDFSDMVSKALQGRLNEVPAKFRSLITKYTGVAEQAFSTLGIDPRRAAVSAERQSQLIKSGKLPSVQPRTTAKVTEKALNTVDSQVPSSFDMRTRQQMIEQDQAMMPKAIKANTPTLEKSGKNIPIRQVPSDQEMASRFETEAARIQKSYNVEMRNALKRPELTRNKLVADIEDKYSALYDNLVRQRDDGTLGKRIYVKNAPKEKPVVSKKVTPVAPADMPYIENSIDPTDPFNNRNVFRRISNDVATRFDDTAKMLSMFKRLEKETKIPGLVDKYYFNTGNIQQSNSIANALMKDSPELKFALEGLSDFSTTGKKARELVGSKKMSDLDRFDEYAAARAELYNYGDKMRTFRSKEENAAIVKAGDAEFSQRFEALNLYYKKQADRLYENGIISKEQLDSYKANDNYIRLQRDMEDVVNPQMSKSRAISLKSTTAGQKRKGSGREILSPVRSLLKRTQQLELEIQRNKAASDTLDMLSLFGLAEKIPSSRITNKNTIGRYVGGKKEYWEVPKDIKEAMENVQPHIMGITARIISSPVRLLRAGATGLSAPFAAKNWVRDQASSGIQSADVIATHSPQNVLSGLAQASKDFASLETSDLWKKFSEYAGDRTVFDDLRNARDTNEMLQGLMHGRSAEIKSRMTHPVRTLEDLIGITEKSTRFQNFKGTYEKVLKESGNEQEALMQGILAARRNSTDFGRSGDLSRIANLFIPFFNAASQGSRTLARSFRERPLVTSMKTISTVMLPTVALSMYNHADENRRKAYESINDFEKQDNFIFISPDAKQNPDGSWEGIVKVPKPQGYRELVDPVRKAVDQFLAGQEPKASFDMLGDMLTALSGPLDLNSPASAVGSLIPQQAKPLVQQVSNKNFYTGKDIVPDFMVQETTDPTKRAYKTTSGTARIIADYLGISPIQVEQFISDTGASVGKYGLNAADRALAASGKIPEDQIGGKDAVNDLVSGFSKASGKLLEENKSDGRKYFEAQKQLTDKLNPNEKAAYQSLHPKKTNFLGGSMYEADSIYNSAARLDIYNRYPKTFEVDKELDSRGRAQGKVGNPLFDLTSAQVKKVLEKANLPPGAKDPELSKLNDQEWYADYKVKLDTYFKSVQEGVKKDLETAKVNGDKEAVKTLEETQRKFSDNPYPTFSREVQAALDYYTKLPKGTGARSSWIRANQNVWNEIQKSFDAVDDWQNSRRVQRGLDAVTDEDSSSSSSSSYKYGSSGGGSGGSSVKALDPRKYRVSLKSGGSAPNERVTVKGGSGATPRKYVTRKSAGNTKVTWKKSKV